MAEIAFMNYELWTISGIAAGAQAWSSTYVSGGGVSTDSQGHVSGGAVRSTIYNHTKFFLKLSDGLEQEITITDGFGVRDGQNITVVCAKKKKEKSGWCVYCLNHTTGSSHVVKSVVNKLTGLGSGVDVFTGYLAAALSGLISYAIVGWWCLLAGPVLGVLFYQLMLAGPKRAKGNSLIKKASKMAST